MLIRQRIDLGAYRGKTARQTVGIVKGLLELYFEAQVRANMVWLMLNPRAPLLYESGVVYRREGIPEQWFDAPSILRRGFDDCEGLAAFLAAEMRVRGPNSETNERIPTATVCLKKTRTAGLWHAQVCDLATGRVWDPSRKLGMLKNVEG